MQVIATCFNMLTDSQMHIDACNRGVDRISDWGGAWRERSELYLGVWGQAPSENFKITVYNDRLYSMGDPLL